jgi:hypothetical protein
MTAHHQSRALPEHRKCPLIFGQLCNFDGPVTTRSGPEPGSKDEVTRCPDLPRRLEAVMRTCKDFECLRLGELSDALECGRAHLCVITAP